MTQTLFEIACRHSPSKLDHPYIKHVFPVYMDHMRDRKVRLLEIGVKRGNSLTMFEEFFPNGQIVGIDRRTSQMTINLNNHPRVQIVKGEQQCTEDLDKCIAKVNKPFNFVVDDGSHRSDHQIASFKYLFPKMKRGGVYFVEDLMFMSHQTSHKEGGNRMPYGKCWMLDEDGYVTHNDFVDYMAYLLRWPLLGRKYWKHINASEEDHEIGKLIHSIHFYQHLAVIQRNR